MSKYPIDYIKNFTLAIKHYRIEVGSEGERVERLTQQSISSFDTDAPIHDHLRRKIGLYTLDLGRAEQAVITACKGGMTIEYHSPLGHLKEVLTYGPNK